MEIQEILVAAQINSFSEAVEKAQRVERAKAQVRSFNARKRNAPSSSRGPLDVAAPTPKIGRDMGKENPSGALRESMVKETFSSGAGSGPRRNFEWKGTINECLAR